MRGASDALLSPGNPVSRRALNSVRSETDWEAARGGMAHSAPLTSHLSDARRTLALCTCPLRRGTPLRATTSGPTGMRPL